MGKGQEYLSPIGQRLGGVQGAKRYHELMLDVDMPLAMIIAPHILHDILKDSWLVVSSPQYLVGQGIASYVATIDSFMNFSKGKIRF